MLNIVKQIYMHIQGKRIWKAKMSEELRIRVTSVSDEKREKEEGVGIYGINDKRPNKD